MSTDTTPSESTSGSPPTYAPSSSATSFIDVSGGLLTEQTIQSLRQERFDHPAATPETFSLPDEKPQTNTALEEEIALTWEQLVERWDEVTQKGELFEMDVSDARNKWILKLFRALDFGPVYQRALLSVSDLEFDLSHKGWPDEDIADYGEMAGARAPVLHTVEPPSGREMGLDSRPSSRGSRSPHDELQKYLNASPDQDWGIVTDGVHLRVLRDFYHTYTRGYVEFDLENIFESRNYQDFRALYRLCHASRFLPIDEGEPSRSAGEVVDEVEETDEADDVAIPLEMLYQTSLATGVKVGQDLQENVISALETLGNGLLNSDIREFLRTGGEGEAQEYYQELLMLIYRLLFLLYAEQRGMMPGRDSLYADEYSITKLRERAEQRRDQADTNTDLWYGLQATFTLAEKGNDDPDVPAYNGMLFDSGRLEHISDSECANEALLSAIADLTLIEREGVLQRISYADLGVEEVGSIYESLLEFTPRLAEEHIELEDQSVSPGEFYLDDRGTERKETGSYYTDPQLVQELIKSTLEPVVNDRLESADDTKEAREDALLDITVCDPACGSAAFLIAATNYLGKRLAQIREEMEYPLEDEIRGARRSVLQYCIYGVDLNPMAVELAKVSLWIDSAVENKPLNFLDHHIKCGNSLLGATCELVEEGVPADAYETSKGRNWHVGNEIRKRVRKENKDYSKSNSQTLDQFGVEVNEYASYTERLNEIEEESANDIHEKEKVYRELQDDPAYQREKLAYDVWTAAFFWPLDGSAKEYPTPEIIEKIRTELNLSDSEWVKSLQNTERADGESGSPASVDTDLLDVVQRTEQIAGDQRFFHWELEFPDVFRQGGFDCILGNPPWDTVEMREKEFFATKSTEISNANTASERDELISDLKNDNPNLYQEYENEVRSVESFSKFLKKSGKFQLTSHGLVNTYAPFSELCYDSINARGRSGLITPTSIATGSDTQEFFQTLVDERRLNSLYDFKNKKGIFPEVHKQYKFCLLTLQGSDILSESFEFAFNLTEFDELEEEPRTIRLTPEEIYLLNPNSKTCPVFQSRDDAELTIKLYRRTGVFKEESKSGNPWDAELTRIFNTSDDSNLFMRKNELSNSGWSLSGNIFTKEEEEYWPLYEAKLMNQFDHRFATFEDVDENAAKNGNARKLSKEEKNDTSKLAIPRYWLPKNKCVEKDDSAWNIGLRDITNATNERTVICSALPRAPTVNSTNLIKGVSAQNALLLIACFNSYVLDYTARQKLGSARLGQYIVRQLPIPSPAHFDKVCLDEEPIRKAIEEHAIKLVYTAEDLGSLAEDAGFDRKPYEFSQPDGRPRSDVRYDLEALMCHIYGIKSGDFDKLFSTFDQIENRDVNEFGYYRTRDEIKSRFEEFDPRISGVDDR